MSEPMRRDSPDRPVILTGARAGQLCFSQPLPSLGITAGIEELDRRFRKRLAERSHSFVPLLLADHRKAVDVVQVLSRKFRVFPHRIDRPALKTGHIEQHTQFRMLQDQSIKFGYKILVIGFCQHPADMDDENLPAILFIELNWHILLLLLISGFNLIKANLHARGMPWGIHPTPSTFCG